jgi:hypothetical protein
LTQRGKAATEVAQTVSLLYRGLAICESHQMQTPADCQSATQQVANLRYRKPLPRHEIWATREGYHG